MQAFATVLKLLAPIPVLVGVMHLVLGPASDVLLGARATDTLLGDPVLDSQNRFYGVVFMGYGALLFLCATDVRRHATLFRILAGFIFLGGVARLLSMALRGVPSAPVVALTVVELAGIPLLLWWHARVLRAG
jgi:Domain of unknown function (DUF4345)